MPYTPRSAMFERAIDIHCSFKWMLLFIFRDSAIDSFSISRIQFPWITHGIFWGVEAPGNIMLRLPKKIESMRCNHNYYYYYDYNVFSAPTVNDVGREHPHRRKERSQDLMRTILFIRKKVRSGKNQINEK